MTQAGEVAQRRVAWLDGVRALAALYVVLHHVWLMTWGGYPGNDGPWFLGWLVHGHLAVAVFIVVSGYSLMLGPARHEGRLLAGAGGFLRRRFWRIVPPYWAALALSVLFVALGLSVTPSGESMGARDVVIHALLLQDVFANVPPNGVFWSIAVEWQIYFFFPLMLWCFRRLGPLRATSIAMAAVVALHLLGERSETIAMLGRFTPQFAVLFVLGCLAVVWSRGAHARAAMVGAAGIWLAFGVVRVISGPEDVVASYFWVDLWLGVGTALAFVGLAGGMLTPLARLLEARPLAWLGHRAYSVYLVHALFLDLVRIHVLDRLGIEGGAAFWPLLVLGVPAAIAGSLLFFRVFERPFLTIRSVRDLVAAVRGSHPVSSPGRRAPASSVRTRP